WTRVWMDLDKSHIPLSEVGDNMLYLRAADDSTVDVKAVLPDANEAITPPTFEHPEGLNLVAVADSEFTHEINVTDEDSEYSLQLQMAGGAPGPDSIFEALQHFLEWLLSVLGISGPTHEPPSLNADGVLSWTPPMTGTQKLLAVATDDTATTALPITVEVVGSRAAAIEAVTADVEDADNYTTETYSDYQSARQDATEAADSGTDAEFSSGLEALRVAVEGLQLLNPRLEDGTLDFSQIVTAEDLDSSTLAALVDGSNQSTWGDQRVTAIVLDFGPSYRVQADRFGFLARDTFANRAEGTNVYGSNDATQWTQLTEHPNKGSDEDIEYVDVRQEQQEERFRFLKLQVDEPGKPTDPAYPGIWTLADFRIDGQRTEAVGSMDTVSLTSNDGVAGRVVAGDHVELDFSGDPGAQDVAVTMLGQDVPVDSPEPGQWQAGLTVPEEQGVGKSLPFEITFVTADGQQADPIAATSDGSSLYVSTDAGLADSAFDTATV